MAVDQLSTTFAALADPTRPEILARLAEGEATVNELAEPFPVTVQAVSKHLKVLEEADLVDVRWEGRTKLHSGKLSAHLPRLIEWLNKHKREGEVECELS